jgi:hypothetical protein
MQFDIETSRTVYNKIRLEDKEIKDVVSKYINRKYNIYNDDWIAEGDLTRSVEYHGSHSWFEDEVIRKATEFDAALLKILRELK